MLGRRFKFYRGRYQDLGRDYFDRLDPERLTRYLVRRLEVLGLDVTVTPHPNDVA